MKLCIYFFLAGMFMLANAGPYDDTIAECGKVEGNCLWGPYCFGFSQYDASKDQLDPDPCEDVSKFASTPGCNAFVSVKKVSGSEFELILVGKGAGRGWVGIAFAKKATIMSPDTVAIICSGDAVHKYNIDTPGGGTKFGLDDGKKSTYISNESSAPDGNNLVCRFKLKSAGSLNLIQTPPFIGMAGSKDGGLAGSKFPKHTFNTKSKYQLDVWKILVVKTVSAGSRQGIRPSLIIGLVMLLWWGSS